MDVEQDTAVSDPLKPLKTLFEQDRVLDSRNIEDRHQAISAITLHAGVPVKVRQVFETARNLSLYAFYVYRFHQVSELMAYIAFEMALTKRLLQESPALLARGVTIPQKLEKKINLAVREGWLKAEHSSRSRQIATLRAQDRAMMAAFEYMEEHDLDEIPASEPTAAMIAEELAAMDPLPALHAMREIRNALSHDHAKLSPTSISTLQHVADRINALFPAPASVNAQ